MENTQKRIFVCEMLQESNSFNPVLSGFEEFEIRKPMRLKKAGATIDGMIACVQENGMIPVVGLCMRAKSGGPVDHAVVDNFVEKTAKELKNAGRIDGVLVSMHGATLSDVSDDVCGDILEKIREEVGENMVVSIACDLHANVTEKMMRYADYICGYQTYPHIDHYQVGYRAAMLAIRHIRGDRAKMACVSVPIMASAHGYTTGTGALSNLMRRAEAMVEEGKILDFTVFQVQPWLDIKEIGSVIVVIACDENAAKAAACDLAMEEFDIRREIQGEKLYSVSEVIKEALDNDTDKPVILVDSADSPNAGATGDNAAVLEALLPYSDKLHAAVSITDPIAVEKAFSVGVGNKCDFMIGAALAPGLSRPVCVKNALVKSLHDGDFTLYGPAERGCVRNIGKTAVLKVGQLMIHISCLTQNNGDLNFYRNFGIEPTLCRLVSLKVCTSFRAGYEPISAKICNASTPGAACPDLMALPYKNLPTPFFPFSEISEDMISEPKCFR